MQGAGLTFGTVFAGYQIERPLGRGGMGTVYAARHPRLPRQIALKLLNRDLYADETARLRFEREADVAARLDHPNIVSVLDRGAEDGVLWISMQYVEGSDAAAFGGAPLDPMRAARIIGQTAEALDHAHERGVLHRDVKPANILLAAARDGDRVLLTDFGIARLRDDQHQATKTGEFLATLAYAAPEQLSGLPIDHRADQYALGCTLFALLTGAPPFQAGNPGAVVAAHLTQPAPQARRVVPHLPPAVDAAIARAMAKDPAERFASCVEFAQTVLRALAGPAHNPVPAGGWQPVPQPARVAPHPTVVARTRSRGVSAGWRTVAVLAVLALVGGVGAAGVYWKFLRPVSKTPWGFQQSIAIAFPQLIPQAPGGIGWRGVQCWGVGTVVAQPGDPLPAKQITCKDPEGLTIWFTEYEQQADVDTYLRAHTTHVGEREFSRPGGLRLYRPIDPAAPFSLATYGWVSSFTNRILVEVSWPGHTFEDVRDQWWQSAPF
ncbi:protein kinase domain-containing protein [Nocardia sp. XZ_19_385]